MDKYNDARIPIFTRLSWQILPADGCQNETGVNCLLCRSKLQFCILAHDDHILLLLSSFSSVPSDPLDTSDILPDSRPKDVRPTQNMSAKLTEPTTFKTLLAMPTTKTGEHHYQTITFEMPLMDCDHILWPFDKLMSTRLRVQTCGCTAGFFG